MSSPQQTLDYNQEAVMRLAWDARSFTSSWAFTLAGGAMFYDLPDDLLTLTAVVSGTTRVPRTTREAALQYLSSGDGITGRYHFTVGRQIAFIPTPSTAETVTLVGVQRPADLVSDQPFPYTGELEDLVEVLVLAETLDDDRQDELAVAHMNLYQRDVERVRLDVTPAQYPSRVAVRGLDRL